MQLYRELTLSYVTMHLPSYQLQIATWQLQRSCPSRISFCDKLANLCIQASHIAKQLASQQIQLLQLPIVIFYINFWLLTAKIEMNKHSQLVAIARCFSCSYISSSLVTVNFKGCKIKSPGLTNSVIYGPVNLSLIDQQIIWAITTEVSLTLCVYIYTQLQ